MHQSFHSTQTWTFKQRTQTVTSSNRPEAFPGPTNYNNQKRVKNYGTATVGKEKRQLFNSLTDGPGPGQYLHKSYTSEGPKATISQRHTIAKDITPSPQSYEAKYYNIVHRSPVYSIGTKQPNSWAKRSSANQPAPNAYNPEKTNQGKSSRIGNSKRRDLSEFERTPGPAAYRTEESPTQKKEPTACFGNAARKSIFDEKRNVTSPGPEKYMTMSSIQINLNKRKGPTMRAQTTDLSVKQRNKIPGPGRYNLTRECRSQNRGYSYGTDQRSTFIDDIAKKDYTPAPNTYTSRNKKNLKMYTFSSSKRKNLSDYETTPGPAVYNTLTNSIQIRTKAPGYSIGKGEKGLDKVFSIYEENPSPFSYSPSYELIKQNSRMSKLSTSKWLKQGKGLDSPGVGLYNLQKSVQKGSTFTKQKRKSFTDMNFYKEIPSAAHYNIRETIPNPPSYMRSHVNRGKRGV